MERITGIVLDVLRHSDRHNVVTLYTRERGRVAFLSPAGSGKAARMRNSRLLPLSVVTSEVNFKGNRELQFLGAVNPVTIWHDLYFNPVKSSIVMFLAEFLNAFLRQSQSDEALWEFIYRSLEGLDRVRGKSSNRHLAFLVGLLPHAGIQPDLSGYDPNRLQWFDMCEGTLSPSAPAHHEYVDAADTRFLPLLERMTMANCAHFKFVGNQRRRVLEGLIHYYSVHYPCLSNLKSPSILGETFS